MAGTQNPYRYGSPVSGVNFAGRTSELSALVERMRSEINVVLVSPRRYGKTSLIMRARDQVERKDAAAVAMVNVLRCEDMAQFVSKLATEAFRGHRGLLGRGRSAIETFVRRFRISPMIEVDGSGGFKVTFGPSLAPRDAEAAMEAVWEFLSEMANTRPAVLVLDEFQAITDLGTHLPSMLKALADAHPKVSLVVAGSRRHLMARLALEKSAPLYGMAQPIALGPIEPTIMARYLVRRAHSAGLSMSDEVAQAIIERAGPVPNDIQRLAFEVYEVHSENMSVDIVDHAMARSVDLNDATFSDIWAAHTPTQRRVLGALAVAPTDQPTGREFARKTGLATSSVQRVVESLDEEELITQIEGRWHVSDPFFAEWARTSA